MKFRTGFISLVPDADYREDGCDLETSVYELHVRLVRDQGEALKVCEELVEEEIHSLILCPGFNHQMVAEISEVLGDEIGVTVARGDSSAGSIARKAMKEAGWFAE